VSVAPPTFLLAVSDAKGMHFSYERYLANRLREAIMLEGTPIRFIMRDKQGRRKRS
jgi:GTP-binding protein